MGEIEDLAENIEAKGLFHPILVDDEYNLIAVGRRLEAMKQLGWDEIPVIVKSVASQLDSRELELFENIMRLDLDYKERALLVDEINELMKSTKENWSLRKTAGLIGRSVGGVSEQVQLAKALKKVPELFEKAKTESEAQKTLKEAYAELALRELEKRRGDGPTDDSTQGAMASSYQVGDALKGLEALPTSDPKYEGYPNFCLVEVDPPYAIELDKQKRSGTGEEYEEIPIIQYPNFLDKLIRELYRVTPENAFIIFWFAVENYQLLCNTLITHEFNYDPIPCIWSKGYGQTNNPRQRLVRTYETFLVVYKGGPVLRKPGRSNIFEYDPVPATDKYHPTQKPLGLMEEIITVFGPSWLRDGTQVNLPDWIPILCPFLGSGSTIVAGARRGYRVLGWDLSMEYKSRFLTQVQGEWERKFTIEV